MKLGNTLMGPITADYVKQKLPRKTKAYLSEASAAMLSVHPLFSGTTQSRDVLPTPQFEDTKISVNKKDRTIVVTGSLKQSSDIEPHRILVFDDRADNTLRNPDYWVRAFVSKLDENSKFSVAIPNPNRSGKIKLVAVYKNGAVTGDGKLRGLRSAKVIPYSF